MGFLDKAKKLAEQAQTKLDEVQSQTNRQGPPPAGPPVEYDQHGRPIRSEGSPTEPVGGPPPSTPGVPPTEPPSGPPAPTEGSAPPPEAPGVPPGPSAPPAEGGDKPPAMPGAPGVEEDRNRPSYAPPKLSSGDPLAG